MLAAACLTLGAPVRPRDSAILGQLHGLKKAVAKRSVSAAEISDDLYPALGVEHLSEVADLLTAPVQFVATLDIAIAEFASDPETILNRRGGRRRDPRIGNFAYRLALIYEEYTGECPTFTQDKEKGWAISPFGLFAYEAFCQLFLPHLRAGEGQLREATRDAVALMRDAEMIPEDELDEVLPKSS